VVECSVDDSGGEGGASDLDALISIE